MAVDSIETILTLSQRKLVVARHDVNLSGRGSNDIFVLMVEESSGSAGGRAAGSGSRKINRVLGFRCIDGVCSKSFDSEAPETIEKFDIPYSAVAMDILLSDNKPFVVQGVVDSGLVDSYVAVTG
ncbi:MAG: hypothetical protein ABI361_02480 [Nitrososphaera sp.]